MLTVFEIKRTAMPIRFLLMLLLSRAFNTLSSPQIFDVFTKSSTVYKDQIFYKKTKISTHSND